MVKRVQGLRPLKTMPRGILKVSSSGSSMVTTRNLRRSSPRKRRRVTFGEEPLVFCGAPTKKPVFFPASPTSMLASRIRSGKVSEIVKVLSHVTFPLRKKKLFFFFPFDAQRLPQRKKKKKKAFFFFFFFVSFKNAEPLCKRARASLRLLPLSLGDFGGGGGKGERRPSLVRRSRGEEEGAAGGGDCR